MTTSKPRIRPVENIKNSLRARRPESCSVYGSGENAQVFLQVLGKDGIRADLVPRYHTKYHAIMMDSDSEALNFFTENRKRMEGGKIVLALDSNMDFVSGEADIYSVTLADVVATMFWRTYPAKPEEKIAFLGDTALIVAMLRHGLCMNIYGTSQLIEYRIYNKEVEKQICLDNMLLDAIFTCSEGLSDCQGDLARMDRVVLCGSKAENGQAFGAVKKYLAENPSEHRPQLYIYDGDSEGEGVIAFGLREEILSREIVLKEEMVREAKALNDYYRSQFGGQPWEKLEPFKRQSSICSAAYFPVVQRLYKAGVGLEALAELEHIRWNRFHYLNGWSYGAVRDDEKKIHNCLVPYAELSEEEKQKDRNNVQRALKGF